MSRLETHPIPAFLNEPAEHMFTSLAAEMPTGMRLVFSNLWFFEPILLGQLTAKPQTNASVRSTTALTIFQAGNRDNVLPQTARGSANFRIAPGQTIEDIEEHVASIIDDERVIISRSEAGFTSNPSPVSSIDTPAFEHVRRTTREIFGEEIIVIPGLMVGGTDSRWFADIADNIYRFIPSQLSAEDTRRIHGIDERIRIDNYENIIRYYAQLMRASPPQ
jgi:carboxypeptidase PM20D1